MSSSDSDDCYGNIAQKLQSMKNKFLEESTSANTSIDNSLTVVNHDSLLCTDSNTCVKDSNLSLDSTDEDDMPLQAVRAKTTPSKRGRKRKATDSGEPTASARASRRNKTTVSNTVNSEDVIDISDVPTPSRDSESVGEVVTDTSRGRQKRSRVSTPSRGRGTVSRGRGRGTTPRSRGRARARGRNRRNYNIRGWFSSPPIYSIGNTDDYPDLCDSQELFSTNASKSNDIEIVEDEDPLATDNEELSVKVYWQSLRVVRFKIRKYQKLTSIFEYFSERENVTNDKLLFVYNDRILKIDDTPDSIDYNIAKFIDGGIVDQDVTGLIKQNSKELKGGLRIKFQCQNSKKPYETTVKPEEKLAMAMMKCAEHFETPLEQLKFYFDGYLVSRKDTAQELELEGGECIDVKISS